MKTKTLAALFCAGTSASILSGCVQFFAMMPHSKWGFIDKTGKMVIPAKFDDVARDQYGGYTQRHKPFKNFSEGLCAVRVGNKWGYIDKGGNFVVIPSYDNAGQFSQGRAFVRLGTKYGYIDKSGKVVIPIKYDFPAQVTNASSSNPDWDFTTSMIEPYEFSEGLAVATVGDKSGYIGRDGKTVIEPTYARAEPFSEGLASVILSGASLGVPGYTYINKQGKVVLKASALCFDHSEGIFLASNNKFDTTRRIEMLDAQGQKLNAKEFPDIRIFSEGLAAAMFDNSDGKYGYIDRTGKTVIPTVFKLSGNNMSGDFHENRAIGFVEKTDAIGPHIQYGVIDNGGKWIVNPSYDHISAYCDGFASSNKGTNCIYLDHDGYEALKPNTYLGNSFSEGLAAIMER